MKHDIKKLPKAQIEVSVTLDDKEFAGYYEAAETKAAGEVTIKGFRKGAAPKEMVAAALDHDAIFHSAINEAVRWSLNEIKIENNWTFIDQPKIEITEGEPGKGITYKASLTIFPEIKLGDISKIAKKVFADKKPVEVTEEEVAKTLEWIRGSRAAETRVVREAKLGDLVEADIDTECEEKPVKGASLQNDRFILGESNFIVGFDKHLEGKKENEVIKFSIVAPKDYWQKELQGKQLDFTVTLRGVFERKLPDLTDEFAVGLGGKFKTVEDLKNSIKEGVKMEKQEKELEKLRIKVLEEISKDSKMDIPDIMVERTLDDMMDQYGQYLKGEATDTKQEEFRSEMRNKLRERAVSNVSNNLVMYKIAQEQNLVPTAEEIEAEAAHHNVDAEKQHEQLYAMLQNKKVFEYLESFAVKA
jgi:trigger factor